MKLTLKLPLPVSINDLYINQYVWNPKSKTRVPSGKRILSKEGEKVKEKIIEAAKDQVSNQMWDYEYTMNHYLYMDSIIYFNRKGRDDNNIYKLNNDALEKIVYDNDSRVLTRTQRILYDKKNPRIELTFSPVEYIGIFDNEETYIEFLENCKTCSRYKRNCSILKAATEGYVQDEIIEGNCFKYKRAKVNE
ncbi:RusA family crossover junction endodeoxyribonuclease [Paenibacillus sp. EKM102P]|uniref:RusA family crossover junction endodeoxyribonuclease n=1 Tax=unclassified Paenibacillus TaxID=185978 RepID=UPI00142E8305|nr:MULTISPECIES: RusA family crossover junction endodeoxyribonuclease [unclassified Paenibacillus]KAF6620613.1 RusA family crossover junction endodeoxyribonuclease [Paenibacillus sp. EKM101P]KAF6623606.1 RusA family crossover junction endodeoxyribonuclease [Paenibacillus sp. EKM102P]KAF6633834.1 RusA family crossover junction endodeoxyribonuclease [Paenibacillus sp. EKM10P]KAF6649358.1 RusA family crossover junction endodeoxyribonuclease [Paenibacillus sp. EKM11P]